ncbi:twin-arginine translocation signal domain-containing protein, partial [Bradyrhizobium ottawaense]
MLSRRQIMRTSLAAGAAALFAAADVGHAAEVKLSWKHFPAGPNGFFRAPVLLSGPTEAVLIDGG